MMTQNAPLAVPSSAAARRGAGTKAVLRGLLVVTLVTSLAGCNAFRRLSEVGEDPKLSPIENPVKRPEYQPVSMPMPTPLTAQRQANSLWRPGARAFFKDQRASQVGDIVTVNLSATGNAALANTTTTSRDNSETLGVPNILGFETETAGWLPEAFNPANAVNIEGEADRSNGGTIARSEAVSVTIAAVVTQVLPNGNLVIFGRQEVRVNQEVRQIGVTGIVRPQDISANNTVALNQIGEARVSYGGRGALSDVQQPRYGTQILDILLPF